MRTIEPTKAPTDEVLAELRRHKREIAEQHGFDVRELAIPCSAVRRVWINLFRPPPNQRQNPKDSFRSGVLQNATLLPVYRVGHDEQDRLRPISHVVPFPLGNIDRVMMSNKTPN